jgi:O-antigen/teichoic acid export membrane protein
MPVSACSESVVTRRISPAGLSLRSSFLWALGGNLVYAACQWGMIVALAKLGSSYMVGQFSLGLAIATPVLMFTNLQLRSVQATDATDQYSFQEYLGLRVVMTLIAMSIIFGITWGGGYEHTTAKVILAVASAKSLESLSDIFYGLFQLHDHLDQTGTSMMLRGILSVIGLSTGLYMTASVYCGVVVLALVWLGVLVFFDVRRGARFLPPSRLGGHKQDGRHRWRQVRPRFSFRRHLKLVRLTLPLGIVMTLVSLNLNMPRYFIHARMGEHQLGVFSALAYATVAVTLVADALGHSATPAMSRLYARGEIAAFRRLLFKLVAFGALLGVSGAIGAELAGARLLTISYSAEYAGHAGVFVWLMIAAGISCVASLFTYAITAARCFRIQVPMFALAVGANVLGCAALVPAAGLTGAATAVVIAATVQMTVAAAVLYYLFSSGAKDQVSSETAEAYYDRWEPGL